jgi:hypothetical protein
MKAQQRCLLGYHSQPEGRQSFIHFLPQALGVLAVLKRSYESSSARGLHPRALTEPDVKLSPRPALTIQPPVACQAANEQRASALGAQRDLASASTCALAVGTA